VPQRGERGGVVRVGFGCTDVGEGGVRLEEMGLWEGGQLQPNMENKASASTALTRSKISKRQPNPRSIPLNAGPAGLAHDARSSMRASGIHRSISDAPSVCEGRGGRSSREGEAATSAVQQVCGSRRAVLPCLGGRAGGRVQRHTREAGPQCCKYRFRDWQGGRGAGGEQRVRFSQVRAEGGRVREARREDARDAISGSSSSS
jgi:hypothetical protein